MRDMGRRNGAPLIAHTFHVRTGLSKGLTKEASYTTLTPIRSNRTINSKTTDSSKTSDIVRNGK